MPDPNETQNPAPSALASSEAAKVIPPAKAGTIASDGDEVKTYPPHFIREKVHTGNGNFKWSEPFDPAVRAREEAADRDEKLAQRGKFPEPEPKED